METVLKNFFSHYLNILSNIVLIFSSPDLSNSFIRALIELALKASYVESREHGPGPQGAQNPVEGGEGESSYE